MIGSALKILLTDETISPGTAPQINALTGGRVSPQQAKQTAAFPFVVYTIDGTQPNDTKSGPSLLDEISVSFFVVANSDFKMISQIADLIRECLDRYSGTITDSDGDVYKIQSIQFTNERTGFDEVGGNMTRQLIFKIRHDRS